MTLLALLGGLAACGSASAADPGVAPTGSDPDGRTFVVTGVTEHGKSRALVKGSEIRLRFDDDRLVVTAGCNTMSGTFHLEASRLTVDGLAMTEMGCAHALMAQDSWVAGLFARASQLNTGNDAALISGDVVLVLEDREQVSPDKPLVGTKWILDSIGTDGNDGTVSSMPQGVTASITLADDDTVGVSDGCNGSGGPAKVDDDTIVWGERSTTAMLCSQPGMLEVGRAMREILHGATGFKIDEKTLTITKGDRFLGFRAR